MAADSRDVMELATAFTNIKSAEINSQIQMRVAKKILDVQEMSGSAAIKLLDAASSSVVKAGDQLVAEATGLGGQLDVYA